MGDPRDLVHDFLDPTILRLHDWRASTNKQRQQRRHKHEQRHKYPRVPRNNIQGCHGCRQRCRLSQMPTLPTPFVCVEKFPSCYLLSTCFHSSQRMTRYLKIAITRRLLGEQGRGRDEGPLHRVSFDLRGGIGQIFEKFDFWYLMHGRSDGRADRRTAVALAVTVGGYRSAVRQPRSRALQHQAALFDKFTVPLLA